jgi:hypothetical protein
MRSVGILGLATLVCFVGQAIGQPTSSEVKPTAGMQLSADTPMTTTSGHGGNLFGYKSDMVFLPDHGVGAVILTNSDTGAYLTGLLRRRLLEVLFDGRTLARSQARRPDRRHHGRARQGQGDGRKRPLAGAG